MLATDQLATGFYTFINFANMSESEKMMVLSWRNHESVRNWMYNTKPIQEESHLEFIEKLKADETKKFLLVKRGQAYLGVYSLVNMRDGVGEAGFYINPEMLDKNLGFEFCYFTFMHLFGNEQVKKIVCYALTTNRAPNSFNKLFGFTREKITKPMNGKPMDYYYGELDKATWEKAMEDPKVKQLVRFSLEANKIL